jgi:hypothetical protein
MVQQSGSFFFPVLAIVLTSISCGSKGDKQGAQLPVPQPRESDRDGLALAPRDLVLSESLTATRLNEFSSDLTGKKTISIAFNLKSDSDYTLKISSVYRGFSGCKGDAPVPSFNWKNGDSSQITAVTQDEAFQTSSDKSYSLVVTIDNSAAECKTVQISFGVIKIKLQDSGRNGEPQEPVGRPTLSGRFQVPLAAGFSLIEPRTDTTGCNVAITKTMGDLLFKPGDPAPEDSNTYMVENLDRSLQVKFYRAGLFINWVKFDGQSDVISEITDQLLAGKTVRVTKERDCAVAGDDPVYLLSGFHQSSLP